MMTDEDRMRIAEIVRIEVRMAIRDLHIAEACIRLGDAGMQLPKGLSPPVLNDEWVHEDPFPFSRPEPS